jgi:hypothetical protein
MIVSLLSTFDRLLPTVDTVLVRKGTTSSLRRGERSSAMLERTEAANGISVRTVKIKRNSVLIWTTSVGHHRRCHRHPTTRYHCPIFATSEDSLSALHRSSVTSRTHTPRVLGGTHKGARQAAFNIGESTHGTIDSVSAFHLRHGIQDDECTVRVLAGNRFHSCHCCDQTI